MLVEAAEEPGLWLPPQPGYDVVTGDGFALVTYGRSAWVHRIRLPDADVERAVGAVRGLVRERGLGEVSWWLGGRTRPRDLSARLRELGLEDGEPPAMETLVIDRSPSGEPGVAVRRVETIDDYLAARDLDSVVFGLTDLERAERLEAARTAWAAVAADGGEVTFLALADEMPVGFGRVVFTPHGGLLLGGGTLPEARGRGVYGALVHARWREAEARGIPLLAVAAGRMSAPILRALGFRRAGDVQLLCDRL